VTHPILELQAADTLADQLRHRRQHMPEQAQVDASRSAHRDWEVRRDGLRRQLDELDAAISRSEAESHEIDLHRARLERQLKTVIAPREAEALMHEIAVLNERRGELDDTELGALEDQARIDDELVAHLGDQAALETAMSLADDAAAVAAAQIDEELAGIASRHDALRSAVDAALLRRYDELRRLHVVAAAALNGHRCEGCHLDLSAGEIDDVRAVASGGELPNCPHCGRLLVV
jgi:predicted  nucleic acid-binding Zn-ribbon protein